MIMVMLKSKQPVIVIVFLLAAMVIAYYATDGNVLSGLIGCLAIVLHVMVGMFVAVRKGLDAETRREVLQKKRNIIVVGILGTVAVAAMTALIILYLTNAIQFV